jgi:2-keto-4-pentenoate hydratase/2-oxohepta-3-ene-1,7-dioic acid hydratase in catechol pathway
LKLVSFSTTDGQIRAGSLIEEANLVVDLTASGYLDALAAIAAGCNAVNKPGAYAAHRLSDVRLHAPLSNPPRIFAIGLNYRDHAKESGMAISATPVVFFKLPSAVIGPGESIVLPKNSTEPDYEAEFAFVIGKGGYRIPASAWRDHVYGYTIVNDVSARDVQFATTQWSMAKSFPTFCPIGPAIVTADEIPDPQHRRRTIAKLEHQRIGFQDSGVDRVSLLNNPPAPRRHRLHRHASRRRPGPHAKALAQTWGNRLHHRRRPRHAY